MKTILLLLLPFLGYGQQYQAINIQLSNGTYGVPVLVTDNLDDSVIVYTDSLGTASGYIINDFGDWMYGYFTDCSGVVQSVDLGGVDTLWGSGTYCAEVSPQPFYELVIGSSFSLVPELKGVHFKSYNSSMVKVNGSYSKWSSGLYYVSAFKGNDLIQTFQIYKAQ